MNVALAGDESAPPLVLLHGLAERWQVFERLLPLLAPQLRLVAIDLPGFGSSPPLEGGGFDLGVVCGRIEAVISELGLERPAMLGHSLGGGVSARYAADRPGALRALILISPAGFIATGAVRPSWRRPRLHALGRAALRLAIPLIASRRGLRERAFARVVGDPASLDAALARELMQGAAHGRSTPAAGIEIVYAGLRDRIAELTLPALVVWGERDRVVSPRFAEQLRDALPDGRLLLRSRRGARADVRAARSCGGGDPGARARAVRTRHSLRFATARAGVRAPCELSTIATMLRKDGKIELLKNVPLLSRCSKKQLAAIASLADVVELPAGTELITEGAQGREFMVMVEGTGEVRRKRRKIDTIGPGDFIGEIALIMGGPRNATVVTTSDSSLLVVTARQFWALLDQAPEMQANVIKALGERLQPLAV